MIQISIITELSGEDDENVEVDFLGFDFKWSGGTNTTSSVHDQISTNPGDDYEDCYDLYDTAGTCFSPRIALTTADLDLRDTENAHVYIKRSGTSTIISYENNRFYARDE